MRASVSLRTVVLLAALSVGCGKSKSTSSSSTGGGTTAGASSAGSSSASSSSGSTGSSSSASSSGSSSSGAGSTGSSGSSGSSGSTGSSSGGTSGGALACPPGRYDFDKDPADGCEVTCDAAHCAYPDGGTVPLDALPPLATNPSHAGAGAFAAGASTPMTSAHHTVFGTLSAPGDGPSMSSTHHQMQGGFLHP